MRDAIRHSDGPVQNVYKSQECSPAMCQRVPSTKPPMCHEVPSFPRADDGECASECLGVPNRANFYDDNVDCKTNPTPRRPLTDVQLAVARWIVAGYGSSAIARRLGLNHHPIARWKRDPRVVAVIEQLRARADAAVVAMVARNAATAAGGSPRS